MKDQFGFSESAGFYQDWLWTIARFVAEIWLDDEVDVERARQVTVWSMTEFVPTIPNVLGTRISRVADVSASVVLHQALVELCATADYERANTALRAMANGLGLSDESFVRVAADMIDFHG